MPVIAFKRHGFELVRVLPELEGKPWNEVTQGFMRALRPSSVRVIPDDGCITSEWQVWRVTVHLARSGSIASIYQEVEVDLPDDVPNGYALRCRLGSLPIDRTATRETR